MATKVIGKCAVCGYPLPDSPIGSEIDCPNCHSINERIASITIPTPVVVGIIAFAAGVILGPAVLSGLKEGAAKLERATTSRLSR